MRFWEIDFLRGIAICMMVTFHILMDLEFFDLISLPTNSWYWNTWNISIGSLFLLLVGISLSISYQRAKQKYTSNQLTLKYTKRGIIVIGYGLIITLFTYLIIGNTYVRFGILHLIGSSIILSIPILHYLYKTPPISLQKKMTSIIAFSIILLSTPTTSVNTSIFTPIGFPPHSFTTIDYYPLIPWIGVVYIGIVIGHMLYKDNQRTFVLDMPYFQTMPPMKILQWAGQHSLIIYLVHQPIIIGLIYILLTQ